MSDRNFAADGPVPTLANQIAATATYKVLGEHAAPDGTGVRGHNTATTGTALGVEGLTASPGSLATGVKGGATAGSGLTVGVHGVVDSPDGIGVFAEAPHGTANAVFARSDGPGAETILAKATATTGGPIGVEGHSQGNTTDAAGVKGMALGDPGSGPGVRGIHRATTGSANGVEGRTRSPDGYGLATPDDALVEGAIASTGAADIQVDGTQVAHLSSPGLAAGNVVFGHSGNGVFDDASAAAIGGGGYFDGFTFNQNEVYDDFGTIAGGEANIAGSGDGDPRSATHATVGGGRFNEAIAPFATIGGGGPTDENAPGSTNNVVTDEYGTIGGGGNNQAGDATSGTTNASFATVAGGGYNTASGGDATVGGGVGNTASGGKTTVGGGDGNTASSLYATVGGGFTNEATGEHATVGGGNGNVAGGEESTVPGGTGNDALGRRSFAAGFAATAAHDGTFVWRDNSVATGDDLQSTGPNQFLARATNGFWFGDTDTADLSNGFINTSTGAYLSGGGTWVDSSSVTEKSAFEPVDPTAILEAVADLPVSTWSYDADPDSVRHLGPTAEAFHAAFGLGGSRTHLASLDTAGVALAAIQGLVDRLAEKDDRIAELAAENAALEDRVAAIEAELGTGDAV